ncbi:MAG TPA: DNA translocase FtsK, partial [Negativicutes bacterium]|nr:DNA translocase FtsK [Negativicutes bacterium]
MAKNDTLEKGEKPVKDKKKEYLLTIRTKRQIKATVMFLVATIITLSFFEKAGMVGRGMVTMLDYLLGDSKIIIATIILSLFTGGFVFLRSQKKVKILAIVLALAVLWIGVAGIASNQNLNSEYTGLFGWAAKLLVSGFGLLVSNIIFAVIIMIGLFIFGQFMWDGHPVEKESKKPAFEPGKSFDSPNLKIKGVGETVKPEPIKAAPKASLFGKTFDTGQGKEKVPVEVNAGQALQKGKYALPPIDLLSKNETVPTSGNIKENSLIIKKTFENFGIPVEMTEVNVGPAVTQYAFKPAEWVKLSKITTLSNN